MVWLLTEVIEWQVINGDHRVAWLLTETIEVTETIEWLLTEVIGGY